MPLLARIYGTERTLKIMVNNRSAKMAAACLHEVNIKGLCGDCGARIDQPPSAPTVSMIHSVPELKVSQQYAERIGKADQERLIRERKLVLLVDLDQTILHTTHEEVRGDSTVHSFNLWPGHPTYYTKLRPYLEEFLEQMSKIYELHIFTFGCRRYAHKIASLIDPDGKYFGNRILSRDESVDQYSKRGNLSNLFPCGDAMVCIIDDRADVWRDAANLIQVKPYTYFKTSISDGASPRQSASAASSSSAAPTTATESATKDSNQANATTSVGTTNQSDSVDKQQAADDSSTEEEDDDDDEDHDNVEDDEALQREADMLEALVERPEDTHLRDLPVILTRIHSKWYKENDERMSHLEEGEHYRLPDIKDIIRTYLRKRY